MVMPIAGRPITTPYGKRGSHWSCRRNSAGQGIHTGADIAAPVGTPVLAMRSGVAKHVNYGSAFGSHQLAILCADGTEDFYAHMRSRVANGTRVVAGHKIGEVGVEGNTTGAHLHFERHTRQGHWNCDVVTDPKPSIDYVLPTEASVSVYLSKLHFGQSNSDSVKALIVALNAHHLDGGATIPVGDDYTEAVDAEVRKCQRQHGFGDDPPRRSSVGPRQAEHLFPTSTRIINDIAPPGPSQPPVEPQPPEAVMGYFHDYTDKPSDAVVYPADDTWRELKGKNPLKRTPFGGKEDHMAYARINFRWKTLSGPAPTTLAGVVKAAADNMAKVEIKFVRGDGDETAFDERHYAYGTKSVPFQQLHWEDGEKGLAGKWYIKCHGGLTSMEITTRYAKTSVVAPG